MQSVNGPRADTFSHPELAPWKSLSGKHMWDGENAPKGWFPINLRQCEAYRPAAEHHGLFAAVWSVEQPLVEQGWKLHVDSLLRLLQAEGVLVLSFTRNLFITAPALKSFLFRKFGFQIKQLLETETEGSWLLVFSVVRMTFALQKDSTWTFSVLTRGDRPQQVAAFCESVRNQSDEAQIVVVGPRSESLAQYRVNFIDRDYGPYSAIAEKKNDVAAIAYGENILFSHDRYVLREGFLDGFEKYGYDFEYVTSCQFYTSGKPYPELCAIDDLRELILGQVYNIANDKEVWMSSYLNGGFFIVKKHVILSHPMNPLLYHHQAEDVEFSRMLASISIMPRLNRFSAAVTDASEQSTLPFSDTYHSDFHTLSNLYYPTYVTRKKGIDSILERLHQARFNEGAKWPTLLRILAREFYRWLPP